MIGQDFSLKNLRLVFLAITSTKDMDPFLTPEMITVGKDMPTLHYWVTYMYGMYNALL